MCRVKERVQAVGFVPKGFEDLIQCGVQIVNVVRNDVGQGSVLGLIPDILDRVKVRGIRRKPFHLKPRCCVRKQLSGGRAMRRQAIPHQNDGTTQMSVDFAHEPNEIRRPRIVLQEFVVQPKPQRPGRSGDGGDRCDSIASIPCTLQGRFAPRRPHAPPQGLQQKPTFVEKNQASLTFEALFLVAAKIRDASGQCPPRSVRGLAAPASVDSSLTDAANAARIPDDTRRRTVAGSCRALKVRSIHPARIPNTECRESKQRSIRSAGGRTAWGLCLDDAWTGACFHASTPASIGGPMKRWSQQPQPLPSTTYPSRKAGLRSFDGLRVFRGFQLVSCPNCTEATPFSIN